MTVGGPPNMVPTIQATDKHVESLRIPWLDVGSIPTGSTQSKRKHHRVCAFFCTYASVEKMPESLSIFRFGSGTLRFSPCCRITS